MKLKKILNIFLVTILLIAINSPMSLAQGDQAGSTSKQKPLNFVSANLLTHADGKNVNNATSNQLEQLYKAGSIGTGENIENASNIPLKPVFNFQFDKNVVNVLIPWTNNINCFKLTAGKETIPITVLKLDDTIDSSRRQNIYVEPVNSLKPGTEYHITISANLKAKNGVSLGQDIAIVFKTQAGAVQSTTSGKAKPDSTNAVSAKSGTTSSPNWIVLAGSVLIAGWLVVEIVVHLAKSRYKYKR